MIRMVNEDLNGEYDSVREIYDTELDQYLESGEVSIELIGSLLRLTEIFESKRKLDPGFKLDIKNPTLVEPLQ